LFRNDTTSLARLPVEILLATASFLGPEDALALGHVRGVSQEVMESCALWKEIAKNVDPILEEIFESLSKATTLREPLSGRTTFTGIFVHNYITGYSDQLIRFDGNETALWRRCVMSRVRSPPQWLSDVPQSFLSGVPYPSTLWIRDPEAERETYYLPNDRYRPKPLGAYSFLLEMEKLSDDPKNKKKCSVFLENIESESELSQGELNYLSFRIPNEYLEEYFPWAEDYGYDIHGDPAQTRNFRVDTTFTIYAIDQTSGKHAKLYHSGRHVELRLGGLGMEFDWQCCGDADPNAEPCFQGNIYDPWKENGLKDKSLDLTLSLWDKSCEMFHHHTIGEDLLLLLEKECVYV